ncbi:MAG: efflux RND transporter periplasmic adaptor subunit [Acidobacteriota bacterium]
MANKAVKFSKKRAIFICALILLVMVATGVLLLRSHPFLNRSIAQLQESVTVQAKINTPLMEVRRAEIRKVLIFDGELRAVKSRTIFATVQDEGKITYMPTEGSLVKAGDRLVEIDSGMILNKIKDVEEKIVAAENEILNTRSRQEATLRDMEIELSKFWMAYEQAQIKAKVPPDVISRREYQESQLILQKSKTEYQSQLDKIEQKKKEHDAELQVKAIEKDKLVVELNQAKSNLDNMNIKAPADGMVIYSDHWAERRKLQVGDVVWGGFPIVSLPDLNEMEVLANVNEVDGAKLVVGQKAKILLDSYPDIEINGAIKEIAQTAVKAGWMARAKIFKVIISMDKTVPEIMKPGMSAQVSIVVADHGRQLLVPRQTVYFEGDKAHVLKAEGEGSRALPVTITATDPWHYAVADNGTIKEGDRIVSR